MAFAFNIHSLLNQIDSRRFNVYDEYSNDEALKKEIDQLLGYLLPLWMSGAVDDDDHRDAILRFDDICNDHWFALRQHPKLQMMLLCAAGCGEPIRHKFFGGGSHKKFSKIIEIIRRAYPDARKSDAKLWAKKHSNEEFAAFARSLGMQEAEVKELAKEYTLFKKER